MIRIIQLTLILMVNNALILLAVADEDFLNIALYGGWCLIFVAAVYLSRGIEDTFDTRYREQESRKNDR